MNIRETISFVKKMVGVLIYDLPRFIRVFLGEGKWKFFHNRNDVVTIDAERTGVRCDGSYTRSLHVCDIFPISARWLLSQALHEHPILLKDAPDYVCEWVCCNGHEPREASPHLSFLIGHRGLPRLPLLLTILKSIASQIDISFECIVVEQDCEMSVRDALPYWVRYIYMPCSRGDARYNRSSSFNEAAKMARGSILVLHDGDMFIPVDYAAEVFRMVTLGFEVVQLKRFVFYLNEESSKKIHASARFIGKNNCERVIENLCAGGSLAVTRQTYDAIGGMDEAFVGWGGEDNEFWDRCQTRRVWEYAYLPFVHLWHSSLADRHISNPMLALLAEKLKISAEDRINTLCALRENQVSRADQEGMAPCC